MNHSCFKLDVRLTVYAGRSGSTICNRNARLTVDVPDEQGKKFHTVYAAEFRSNWHAKEVVDCLLTLLIVTDTNTEEARKWFIEQLSRLETPGLPEPSTHYYASLNGYRN